MRTIGLAISLSSLVFALSACGDAKDEGADMTARTDSAVSAACAAAGGQCVGPEEGCSTGTYVGALGCYYRCCAPVVACTFSSCDGGSCACTEVGQECTLSGANGYCLCEVDSTTNQPVWMCANPV